MLEAMRKQDDKGDRSWEIFNHHDEEKKNIE